MSYDPQTIHDLQKQISELTEFKSKAIGTVAELQAEKRDLKRKLEAILFLADNALTSPTITFQERIDTFREIRDLCEAQTAIDAVKEEP